MCRLKPEATCFLGSGENRDRVSQGLPRGKVTRRCEIRLETQGSTTIGHSGPHDLWGHRAIIRPDLPLLILFPSNSPEEKAVEPLLSPLSERSLQLPAHSSNSNQLQGGELQLPAQLTKETSSQFKLYKPPNSDATSFRRTSSPQRSCKAQQNHEGHTTGKDHFTELRTAQQTLFPFSRMVTQLGLLTYETKQDCLFDSLWCL